MAERRALPRKALKARERAKRKKPAFLRPESWRYDKFSESWRRPRGLDNKMRRRIKGWPPAVSVGYKGPKVARGLHPSGYREVLVHNVGELSGVDPKTQAVRVAHTVGMKKRAEIIAAAKKRRVLILNIKALKAAPEKEEAEVEEKGAEAEKKPAKETKPAKEKKAAKEKAAEKKKEKPKPKPARKKEEEAEEE